MEKRLVRSKNDRMVAGVAGGIANYVNIDPTIIRLLFVILTLAGGPGFIIYIIMWVVLPEEDYVGVVSDAHETLHREKSVE